MALSLHLHHRLPLALLLVVLVAASHGVPTSGDSYDPSLCLKPQLCGSVNISYPFYLSDDTGVLLGNSSSYCGYPGLGIKCDGGNRAVLESGGGKYVISSINDTGGGLTVTVVDKEVLDDQACPKIDHNVTLPPWFTIPNTSVVDGRCQGVFQVPVLKDGVQGNPQNDAGWMKGGFGKALFEGFPLALDYQKPQECVQCEGTHGQCGYNQTGHFVACLCSGG
ncbi:unnamed protein product [Urochloa decumbens]|uniref:Uncharacterized protein n=1 Tax=Urochloa decumbens TaxID=240449 RepID=A0ABC8YU75_9POAL